MEDTEQKKEPQPKPKIEECHKKECPHCGGQILVFIERSPVELEPKSAD